MAVILTTSKEVGARGERSGSVQPNGPGTESVSLTLDAIAQVDTGARSAELFVHWTLLGCLTGFGSLGFGLARVHSARKRFPRIMMPGTAPEPFACVLVAM